MKNIRLSHANISNFKAIRSLEVDFGERTRITGGNGVGKSTIENAYLWCLFGQTTNTKSSTIQPLDSLGNIRHKLTTSVELTLSVDGQEIKVKRELAEKWSTPRGTSQEVLSGTETTYYWNDVPCKMSEFRQKVDAICPIEDWLMITNISAFNRLKQEDKRKKLNALVGEIDDKQVAVGFPDVAEALKAGKTIEELKREVSAKRKKSKIDLDEIPSRIDQQEKLRVVLDFDALRLQSKDLESKIAKIDNTLQASINSAEVAAADSVRNTIAEYRNQLSEIESSLKRERNRKVTELDNEIETLRSTLSRNESTLKTTRSDLAGVLTETKEKETEFNTLKESWRAVNEEQFDKEVEPSCPMCKRPYTAEEIEARKDTMVSEFNQYKINRLKQIENNATECNKKIAELTERSKELSQSIEDATIRSTECSDSIKAAEDRLKAIPTIELALVAHKEYQEIKSKVDTLVADQSTKEMKQPTSNETLKEQKQTLQDQLKDVTAKLAGEATNAHIDALKKSLEDQCTTLAQAVSDMDRIEFQIQQFRKRKIEMVEASVSSLFSIVKWKFYDNNLTNDGEKEICEAIVDGIPYSDDNLNTGMSINAGVDICNAFSKAYGISAPLFVDCCESVERIIDTDAQLITLEVVKGEPLMVLKSDKVDC